MRIPLFHWLSSKSFCWLNSSFGWFPPVLTTFGDNKTPHIFLKLNFREMVLLIAVTWPFSSFHYLFCIPHPWFRMVSSFKTSRDFSCFNCKIPKFDKSSLDYNTLVLGSANPHSLSLRFETNLPLLLSTIYPLFSSESLLIRACFLKWVKWLEGSHIKSWPQSSEDWVL